MIRWKNILALLVVAAIGACAGCATRAVVTDPNTNVMLGGPGWRVYDVTETTAAADLAAIRAMWDDVEVCVGKPSTVSFGSMRWFGVSIIQYREFDAGGLSWRWLPASGMTLIERGWVYVVSRARTPDQVIQTLRHEIIHAQTGQKHPEVDAVIARCDRMDWRYR